MNWDVWPLIVLAMTLLAAARPCMAAVSIARVPPTVPSRLAVTGAGGGAAMLTLAVYLLAQCHAATGSGFWDLPLQALHDAYLRANPAVWTPAICWLFLAAAGSWWLFDGIKAARPPRDLAGFVGGLNEMAIVGSLLLWNVTVPETWPRSDLLAFALRGVYFSYLAGGAARLMLALVSFAMPPAEPPQAGPAARSNSSLRRF